VEEVKNKEEFLNRMEKKYHNYLIFLKASNKQSKQSISKSKKSSCDILDSNLRNEGSLKASVLELIFPGHIKSYYASAEF
jgi:hypothetical protein